jgi:hypothetical protein
MEQWRPVIGYEGLYEVSDLGRIRRAAPDTLGRRSTHPGRVLTPIKSPYLQVTLSKGSRRTRRTEVVHRLVAAAFLGPRVAGQQINHRDGDKHNPRADNLEYVTNLENAQHAARVGLYQRGEDKPNAKLSREAVEEIRTSTESGAALARRFGVTRGAIYHVRKARNWA